MDLETLRAEVRRLTAELENKRRALIAAERQRNDLRDAAEQFGLLQIENDRAHEASLASLKVELDLWKQAASASLATILQLKGTEPALPPRAPAAPGPLPRYGLRWNGPTEPVSTPMDDGYWTPWFLAERLVEALVWISGEAQVVASVLDQRVMDDKQHPLADALERVIAIQARAEGKETPDEG